MISTTEGEGEFIRGFFRHLASMGHEAVALHGWRNDFDDAESDIDLAVSPEAFACMPVFIHDYCKTRGWKLVQLFAHEDTALYGICVKDGHPERVVALDVCSDYQRDGVVFLTSKEMLDSRLPLPWGAWRLSPELEFRYRFCKAGAKGKPADSLMDDLKFCSQDDLDAVARWLGRCWSVITTGENLLMDPSGALADFRKRADSRKTLWRPGSWKRWGIRVLQPGGMVIVWGQNPTGASPPPWMRSLGLSCFRRLREGSWSPSMVRDILRSTLCLCPKAPAWLQGLKGLVMNQPSSAEEVVNFLADRIDRRLGVISQRSQ